MKTKLNSIGTATALTLIFLNLISLIPVSRALSISTILAKKYDTIQLSKPFADAFGEPEANGVWFISGQSTNGKTAFVWKLIKELSQHGRVAVNDLEEHDRKTAQDAIQRTGFSPEERRRIIVIKEGREELTERLKKQKSPRIIVINSIQYMDMNFRQFLQFKAAAANKLVIVISHADGTRPEGRVANRIQYDADLKIWVEGFRAHSKGRYIGPVGYYDIFPEGSATHWGSPPTTQQQ